jgi:hypothetical protein
MEPGILLPLALLRVVVTLPLGLVVVPLDFPGFLVPFFVAGGVILPAFSFDFLCYLLLDFVGAGRSLL